MYAYGWIELVGYVPSRCLRAVSTLSFSSLSLSRSLAHLHYTVSISYLAPPRPANSTHLNSAQLILLDLLLSVLLRLAASTAATTAALLLQLLQARLTDLLEIGVGHY